jgi:hypothetical protein
MEDVLRETKMAFNLPIQSIWECRLRTYLSSGVNELRPDENLLTRQRRVIGRSYALYF